MTSSYTRIARVRAVFARSARLVAPLGISCQATAACATIATPVDTIHSRTFATHPAHGSRVDGNITTHEQLGYTKISRVRAVSARSVRLVAPLGTPCQATAACMTIATPVPTIHSRAFATHPAHRSRADGSIATQHRYSCHRCLSSLGNGELLFMLLPVTWDPHLGLGRMGQFHSQNFTCANSSRRLLGEKHQHTQQPNGPHKPPHATSTPTPKFPCHTVRGVRYDIPVACM